ncbi:Saccharopine dehydrogenase-domain-containing protein [Roridomyces roridus]|uniref:Saccharopine dehydrogenase-domain-containing protein n=1 Tax=Roridomyces roridus TaxID=1738132 RepID=A0AAD7CG48_9AGAR|nr:Saccharopine dehydrogenase-domain-containing protein [Roridomyces roridus]
MSLPDVLVLGATGYTGRLAVRYLTQNHRDASAFTVTLGARSKSRLDALAAELKLGSDVRRLVVDVTSPEQVEAAVAGRAVVLNAVGPFWIWGTPVVEACVNQGVHYVDLTGETPWIKKIITRFHYTAAKTGAIIVPSCGFDSVPADLTTYLSSKVLRNMAGGPVDITSSVSAYLLRGGFSGGSIATGITEIEQVPANEKNMSKQDWSLSPVVGLPSPKPRLVYSLTHPDTGKSLVGSFFFMLPANRAIVQRSWGLFEEAARDDPTHTRYGPSFTYDELFVTSGSMSALFMTLGMAVTASLMLLSPVRWFLKNFVLPKAGQGPSESMLKKGRMEVTNVTTAVASSLSRPVQAKTVMIGNEDPGYALAAVMVSEAALALALDKDTLPALAQCGGVLTPATALGDVLVERLEASGRIKFESTTVSARGPEGKKTV